MKGAEPRRGHACRPDTAITLTVKFDKDGRRNIQFAPLRAAAQRAVDVATEALTQGLTRDGVTPRVAASGSYRYERSDPLASE